MLWQTRTQVVDSLQPGTTTVLFRGPTHPEWRRRAGTISGYMCSDLPPIPVSLCRGRLPSLSRVCFWASSFVDSTILWEPQTNHVTLVSLSLAAGLLMGKDSSQHTEMSQARDSLHKLGMTLNKTQHLGQSFEALASYKIPLPYKSTKSSPRQTRHRSTEPEVWKCCWEGEQPHVKRASHSVWHV